MTPNFRYPATKSSFAFVVVFIVAWAGTNVVLYHKLQRDEPMSATDPFILGSSQMDPVRVPVNPQKSSIRSDGKDIIKPEQLESTKNDDGDDGGEGESEGHINKKDDYNPSAPLSCEKFGGPDDKAASELSYWSDIPSDNKFVSPFYDEEKYLTFEPDIGGWNNVRMSYETIILLAHAMGRTLVLPPKKGLYLLIDGGKKDKKEFTINDFVPFNRIVEDFNGLHVISMDQFLRRKALTGQLKNMTTGEVVFPPENRTNFDGQKMKPLWHYMRSVGYFPEGWEEPMECFAALPSKKGKEASDELQKTYDEIVAEGPFPDPLVDYVDKPTDVDGSVKDRMREMVAGRRLCLYNEKLQEKELLHFRVEVGDARMLTHFYSFLFYQDWKQDLWSKRLIRDHFRYVDEIMCAGARIVQAVRERARKHSPSNKAGVYDSFHVRRGDFQFKKEIVNDIGKMWNQSKEELEEGGSLFIATDERNKTFFELLNDHYDVSYLDDYLEFAGGINPNFYGMLDQLVASKGRTFFGCWWSTYSGYINRLRGYHSAKNKEKGYELGHLNSYYFLPAEKKYQMTKYHAVKVPLYMREFPTSWRDIDRGIDKL